MRLRPLVRAGLGIATLVAASTVLVAIGDRHWAAAVVLGVLAVACVYPALTGRDPFDARHRRRRHRRHRSKRHSSASTSGDEPRAPAPATWHDADRRA